MHNLHTGFLPPPPYSGHHKTKIYPPGVPVTPMSPDSSAFFTGAEIPAVWEHMVQSLPTAFDVAE